MPTIKLWVETGFSNATHEDEVEIPDEEWITLTSEQQQDLMDELAKDFRDDRIEYGASIED